MKSKRIVIISGPPGSGKSSISKKLAENSAYDKAIHMHTDDFYNYIRKGYIEPWLPESHDQNNVIVEAFVASAVRLAGGGYEVFVDGVVSPCFINPWLKAVADGFDVRYIILRPDEETVITRAISRDKDTALTDADIIRHMWRSFSNLSKYESHAIDTTNQSVEETVVYIQKLLNENAMRIL